MRSERRHRDTVLWRCCLVWALLCLGSPVRAEVVERILAVVDGRPVLLSEIKVVERVSGLDRAKALEALIDERLMHREAARLPQAALSPEEEDSATKSLLARDPTLATALPEEDLRRLVRRQATTLKYVGLRFSPQVRVGDEEVERAYRVEYGGRADAPPLTEVAEALRERLFRKALDEKIEAWVQELRSAAEIRYNR